MSEESRRPTAAYDALAEVYDRVRPSYPHDAAAWLAGGGPAGGASGADVLELGAGNGQLTEVLHDSGCTVLATDPSLPMLARLRLRTGAPHAVASAERIPLPSHRVDAVVCGDSFQWFDHSRALAEIARVLRPGGTISLAWNVFDDAIPWVRRLQRLLTSPSAEDPVKPLLETPYFGFVEERQFRTWQPHNAATLADLARTHTGFAELSEDRQEQLLRDVAALYAEYGRGHDGMLVPYLTRCYRAVVRHQELPPEPPVPLVRGGLPQGHDVPPPGLEELDDPAGDEDHDPDATGPVVPGRGRKPPEDPGTQLIDFR